MSPASSTLDAMGNESHDLEKQGPGPPLGCHLHRHHRLMSKLAVEDGEVYKAANEKNPRWYQRLLDVGIEENGIKPVPVEQRISTQYNNLFTVFFTCLLGIIA